MTTQLYTSSRLRVLRSCMRLHHYRYTLGLQTTETDVMRFGTVGHKALEAYYRAWMDGHCTGRLDAALEAITGCGLSHIDTIKLRVLICAYHARWGAEDWEVLAVEVEFRYMLGDHIIGGKIDAIIRDRADGRVYVVEHKTTGVDASLGSAYWEKLTIDTQVSIYIDGATMLGYEVAGCIYDVLKRPGHDPKLATPIEKRKYTKGKGCKRCGGSAKPGAVERGTGTYSVVFGAEVKVIACDECAGTGWKKNKEGAPEAPRLNADQRDTDETPDAFEGRLVEALAEDPDAFLLRGPVVRLEYELPMMRQDLLDAIGVEQTGLTPRNPDNCAKYGVLCGFFPICAGSSDVNDVNAWPRGKAHPELEMTYAA